MTQQVGVRQMKPHKVVDIQQSITNNLTVQQLQIEALVTILSVADQNRWLDKVHELGNKRGINPITGELLQNNEVIIRTGNFNNAT